MKIAIHKSMGSFSDRWISYCKENDIHYKIVNAYDSDIVSQISDCNAFMWHHHHAQYKDSLFARQLLYSLEVSGKKVFPNFNTCWHFDDKIGQKYLLETIVAPFVPSYVFYTKNEALEWISRSTFPKVFKLRCGASAANVSLVLTRKEAVRKTRKAFGKGFVQYDWRSQYAEELRKFKLGKSSLRNLLRPLYNCMKTYPTEFAKYRGNEKGYVYFQDFIAGNTFDIRVIVIEEKAFALKRLVRKSDFRASGSGNIIYKKEEIDQRCVKIAFETNDKVKSQCTAFDFVFDIDNNPLIVEISYGFKASAYDACEGYWDKGINWHEETFNPYGWIIENLLNS
jgi:glutathione synthase/RimK-type ligase-like ATP-grasp enzyme